MSLEDISALFKDRTVALSSHDVAYGIERFLQELTKSQRVQCRNNGSSLIIRVGTPALAQTVSVCEYDILSYIKDELGCAITTVQVIL